MTTKPPAWFCEAHRVWTTSDCPRCDDELIAAADEQDTPRNNALGDRIASAANYPGIVAELFGYLGAAIDDGRTLDPREMHEYLRDLKRRYVTDPVREAIGSVAKTEATS